MKKWFIAGLVILVFNSIIAEPFKREAINKNLFFGKSFKENNREIIKREMDSGKENPNNPPPFDFADGDRVLEEATNLLSTGNCLNNEYKEELQKSVEKFKVVINDYKNLVNLTKEQTIELMDLKYSIENWMGISTKNKKSLKSRQYIAVNEKKEILPLDRKEGGTKVGTGWILDQKIYDTTVEKWYPTMPIDIMSNDEGASDTEVDDDGWVWHVQSFYFSDLLLDGNNQPTHANPSYCLAVYLSPDGGVTWYLYEVLYDPDGKDIINPRLAIDILPSTNRFFIAYEYAYSESDHDIYVYSEDFSSNPNPQDAAIGASSLMERNPDIASDFYQGQTSYRVVVYEKEYSAGSFNYDIYASQSTGAGALPDWSSPIGVAVDASSEKNPSISNGASGYSTITQFMHLAYNYEINPNLLFNPGFEEGNDGKWIAQNAADINCSSGYQRTGSCVAWFGGLNNYTGYLFQDIQIPAGTTSTQLSLYLKISSEEDTSTAYDYFYIEVRDTSNNVLATLATLSNKDKNTYAAYQQLVFDITSYAPAGQSRRIYFRATTDSSLISSFFVDDVAVMVTPPPQFLLNPGFELGNNGNWVVNSSGDVDCSGSYQRTGTCCAWLGGINNYTDFIYQDVYIPPASVEVYLSLYLKITTQEGSTTPYDYLYIQLRDTNNNVLATLQTISNVNQTYFSTYKPLTYNITAYGGQTVRIYFLATTDSSNITNFFIDDTSLRFNPSGYEVRYTKAQHPGAISYPNGLQSSTKLTVLSNVGPEWEYGPPSIVATHGGSSTMTTARVVVAADQHFPADNPNSGDLERHQICYAWSMCNGSTTCGNMICGSDTLSKDWQEGWFYDSRGDERFPSLIQDGAGLPTGGLDIHPYIYMAYFHRAADEPTGLGEVQLILSNPSDETCSGFIYGYWYYFTNSYTASDPDNLVSPRSRTINAFNYWDGWPGITFNKNISHQSGGSNDDVFCTTLGDNYTFYTYSNGDYVNLVISFNGETYSTPHTFPWAAGYKWDIIAVTPQDDGPNHYDFSHWSNDQTDPKLTIVSDFCDPINPCPQVDFTAYYNLTVCPSYIPEVPNCLAVRSGTDYVQLTWDSLNGINEYEIYQSSSDPSLKSNFKLIATVTTTSFLDTTSTTPGVYYYIVVGKCLNNEGQWGGSYDQ